MPICPKCHRYKKKSLFDRHKKICIPSRKDIEHFSDSTKIGEDLRKEMIKQARKREV